MNSFRSEKLLINISKKNFHGLLKNNRPFALGHTSLKVATWKLLPWKRFPFSSVTQATEMHESVSKCWCQTSLWYHNYEISLGTKWKPGYLVSALKVSVNNISTVQLLLLKYIFKQVFSDVVWIFLLKTVNYLILQLGATKLKTSVVWDYYHYAQQGFKLLGMDNL